MLLNDTIRLWSYEAIEPTVWKIDKTLEYIMQIQSTTSGISS